MCPLREHLVLVAPADYVLLGSRSLSSWAAHNNENALRDAQYVVHLRPDWPKVLLLHGELSLNNDEGRIRRVHNSTNV